MGERWDEAEVNGDSAVQWVQDVDFGDSRLDDRFRVSVREFAKAPKLSFPQSFAEDKKMEGLYRFLNNQKVTMQKAMEPQYEETAQRTRQQSRALVVHDTTNFSLGGDERREGMGRINESDPGFLGHFSLVLEGPETREPLGLAAVQPWTRRPDEGPDPYDAEPMWTEFEESEADKWLQGVLETREQVGDSPEDLLHVMDSDADDYSIWSKMREAGESFTIRCCHLNRRLVRGSRWSSRGIERPSLEDAVREAEKVTTREIYLSSRAQRGRSTSNKRKHPPREARFAEVELRRTSVVVRSPGDADGPDELELNVVAVIESDPPEGAQPVEWVLVTTEPIAKEEWVERIVDEYRARWVIEEWFKALKTGCRIEERQFESSHAMLNTLAMTIPVAVQLLRLRTLAQLDTDVRAEEVLSRIQLKILSEDPRTGYEAQQEAEQALRAVAELGGFQSHNDEPGWLTLMRGMQTLNTLETGYELANQGSPSNEAETSTRHERNPDD